MIDELLNRFVPLWAWLMFGLTCYLILASAMAWILLKLLNPVRFTMAEMFAVKFYRLCAWGVGVFCFAGAIDDLQRLWLSSYVVVQGSQRLVIASVAAMMIVTVASHGKYVERKRRFGDD